MAGENDLAAPQIQNGGTGTVSTGRVNAPDYRQIQPAPPTLEPWRLPNDGADARAEALSNAFKEFSNVAYSAAGTLQTQAGQKAGAQAGLDPNFKPQTGLQAATAYGQAYDAAAHSSYITSSQLALEQHLTGIEQANVGNPDAFQAQAGAAVTGALKAMDPLYQPEMTNWATARIQAGVNRQSQQKQTDVQNEALATYQSATPDLITSALHTAAALPGPQGDAVITKLVSDDQDKLNALVASRTITPEQAVSMHAKMVADTNNQMTGQKVDLSLQPIIQQMRSNVEAADKLVIQDDPNLTPEENTARLAQYTKARDAYVQSQTRANVDQLAAVHQQLENGAYGADVEPQLHQLYQKGALSEEGLFTSLAQSLRNQKSEIEDAASMRMVDDSLHGGPRLDPKDPDQQKAANLYFDRKVVVDGGASIGNPQYAMAATEFFRQTNILPQSVQSRIRVGLLSGDPTQATQAAALAAKIQGVNPSADTFVSNPHLAALSNLINSNLKAGMPAQQAYQLANNQTQVTPDIQKTRDARFTQAIKTTNATNVQALQKELDAATPGLFSHSPAAPIEMQAQNDSLVRQYFTQTGDINKARELAVQQLQKTWGVTTVNGTPEIQQYPIKDQDVPAVRADIASSAASAGYTGDPSQIHVTPNANTAASNGRIWSLTHVAADGTADILLDNNNRPLQYHLPESQDFAKVRDQRIAAQLDEARKQRDFERSVSTDQIKGEQQLSDYYLTPQGKRTEQSAAGSR
jgi:hypothetical protein